MVRLFKPCALTPNPEVAEPPNAGAFQALSAHA